MKTLFSQETHIDNGKPNPNDVVLYLHSTYDSNSFHPISIISYPMILVHHRGFHILYGIEITTLVKLQIMEINFLKQNPSYRRQNNHSEASIDKSTDT